MLTGLLKDASFGPGLNLHMCNFYLWKSFDVDSAQIRDSRPYQISFLARFEMRHTRVVGVGIPKYAYRAL